MRSGTDALAVSNADGNVANGCAGAVASRGSSVRLLREDRAERSEGTTLMLFRMILDCTTQLQLDDVEGHQKVAVPSELLFDVIDR